MIKQDLLFYILLVLYTFCLFVSIIFICCLLFLFAKFYSVPRKMSKKDGKEVKEGEIKALYRELSTLKQNEEYEKAIKVM